MNTNSKITAEHLERSAYVYIRQSSLHQVEENLESQDLQYQLVQRARSLGWTAENTQIIDDDLGKSGISAANRNGFQNLVATVGLGQVGIILVTDVSRLARNCTDWFSLLDLASLRNSLICDAGGVYDPRIYDDRLLLGLKGTFAEAQWYSMRTQLGAAKFNKAKRGDLHLRLPVGFVRIADDRVALHPDQQVQTIVRHVFAEFERLGSAHKILRALRDQSMLMPRRTGSSWDPEIRWVRPTFSAIYMILKNPAYAGAYAYGKHHGTHIPGDAHKVVNHPLPLEDWPVLHQQAFPGYISWETFLRNQQILAQNAQGIQWKRGVPRTGLALLQGIAICARCGRLMHVHYTHAPAYVCDHATQQYADRRCQTFTIAYIDPFLERLFLQAVEPVHLQAALAALDQIDTYRQSLMAQWRQRLERARYDTELARRRYERVDPDNRLVAGSLEQDWENCLRQQANLDKEWIQAQSRQLQPLSDTDRQSILALAADLPKLWQQASPADRKRLLRCLIQDVTLDSFSCPGFSRILIRWRTGTTSSFDVPRPRHGTPPATAVADRLRQLATHLPDDQIADTLNSEGFPTATGLPWTLARVRAVRRKHNIASDCRYAAMSDQPRGDGLLPAKVAAARLGVQPCMIPEWFRAGLIQGCQRCTGAYLWVRLNDDDLRRLSGSATQTPEMLSLETAPQIFRLDPDQFRAMLKTEKLLSYRIRAGKQFKWFVLPNNPTEYAQ
jgi:DNA invertase Pin-like site-specific DNA recombinase